MTSKLIIPRTTFTFEPAGSDNQVEKRATNRDLAWSIVSQFAASRRVLPDRMRDLVGSRYVVHAGAPGCGRILYEIDFIDRDGVWGHVLENTIRELDPSEVV